MQYFLELIPEIGLWFLGRLPTQDRTHSAALRSVLGWTSSRSHTWA